MEERQTISKAKTGLVLLGLMASLLIYALDSTVFSTAMKKIVGDLGGQSYYNWPFTVYMLCSTVIIPISGAISDLHGHKPVFLTGIAAFLAGSLLCGFSQNMAQLIIFRGIQGLGGGVIVSGVFIIIADIKGPSERGKYTGIVTSMYGAASIIGPVTGGLVTDYLGWRWIFFLNLPIGIMAALILFFTLPCSKAEISRKADVFGMIVLIFALTPLLLAFSLAGNTFVWNSPWMIAMITFSVVMLFVFGLIEIKAANPTLPPKFFTNRGINTCFFMSFINQALMFAVVIYLPYFGQGVAGLSASSSGAEITPTMIGLLIASFLTGQFISGTGKSKLAAILSFVVTGIGMYLLAGMKPDTPYVQIVIFAVIAGFGVGINMPVSNVNAQNSVSRENIGAVTSAVMFFKNSGRAVGSAVFGAVAANSVGAAAGNAKLTLAASIHNVFAFCIILCLIGAAGSFFLKDAPLHKNMASAKQQ